MHSYQSRWEELSTNQQGQVMSTFKPGDRVHIPYLNTEPAQYRSDLCHLGLELWQPKPDEWCWFWDEQYTTAILAKFLEKTDKGHFEHHGNSFEYCEPFIGTLPSHLKDNT